MISRNEFLVGYDSVYPISYLLTSSLLFLVLGCDRIVISKITIIIYDTSAFMLLFVKSQIYLRNALNIIIL